MRCCVPNCKNDSRHMSKSQGITFHVFPAESGLRKSWICALGKDEWVPKKRSAVCSEHFLSNDLYKTRTGSRRVRAGAVPLDLQDASNSQTNHSEGNFCDVHTDTQTDTPIKEVIEVKNEEKFVNKNNDYYLDVTIVKDEEFISGVDEPAPCPSGENDLLDGDDEADRDFLLTEEEFPSDDSLPLEIMRTQKVAIQSIKSIDHENNQHQIYPSIGKYSGADHRSIYIEHSYKQTDRLITVAVEVKNEDCNNDIFLNENNDCNQEEPIIDEKLGEEPGQDADDPLELKKAKQGRNTEAKIEKKSEERNHPSQESPLTDTNTETMVPAVTECTIPAADSSRITNEKIELKNKLDVQKNKTDREKRQAQAIKNTKTSHNLINDSNYNIGLNKIILNNTKDYSCDHCDYNTNTEKKLNAHLKAHSASIRFSCHLCFYITSVKMSLIKHIRTHTGEKPFSCDVCDKKFSLISNLNTHKILHTDKKPYMSNICNKELSRKHNLDEHLRIHTVKKLYSCDVCDKKFNRKFSLNIHKRLHTGDMLFSCDVCDKKFRQKRYLLNHVTIHTGEMPFSCDVCDQKFNLKSCLDTHMRIHTGDKPYACDVCNKKFTVKSNLNTHKILHTYEKPYMCNICNKKFIKKHHLDEHQRLHTSDKPYACDVCDKMFYLKQHLNAHLKIHTGQKPHTCKLCDKKFIHKHHLDEHLRIHTSEKSYTCNVCDKKITKKSNLARHMRIHTAEMPYACEVCYKQFRQKNDLDRHVRIHTGEMPFSCDVCDIKFNQKSSLDRHNIRKH